MLSRKFIVTVLTLISAVGLAIFDKLDNPSSLVLIACVGAYNGANAWQKNKEA